MASRQQQQTLAMTDAQRAQQQRLRSNSVAASTASSSTEGSTSTASDSAVTSQARRARVEAGEMPTAQKRALIQALNEHRINTIAELRGIERVFAQIGTSDVTRPMTAAWTYYVDSNSLLTELRGLTRNYPFSSECLEEAKQRVHQDPASNRSWNYCWLVLAKAHTDGLITIFACHQAKKPEMWGDRKPMEADIERLTQAFVQEWTSALRQMLRYWESAPIR
ncbi:hypothetical protein K431DRAFT_296040 [Polychaeton citri CBS 116435]|uniref:Uncharacterized protein n=1 Tax=Polychaeton citri CBS 116435 TaxID=1314669 RepID=A0A9P4Q6W2_9PEZI|nr:hypothetical protein K431DRAFT_296040 [Polychaeton citri CBS 116435]